MRLGNYDLQAYSSKAHEDVKKQAASKVNIPLRRLMSRQRCAVAADSNGIRIMFPCVHPSTIFPGLELQLTFSLRHSEI
jgi:hypothetical protein